MRHQASQLLLFVNYTWSLYTKWHLSLSLSRILYPRDARLSIKFNESTARQTNRDSIIRYDEIITRHQQLCASFFFSLYSYHNPWKRDLRARYICVNRFRSPAYIQQLFKNSTGIDADTPQRGDEIKTCAVYYTI